MRNMQSKKKNHKITIFVSFSLVSHTANTANMVKAVYCATFEKIMFV